MDAERVRELFAAFGPVDVRRMFGGAGVFADGVMFALVASQAIYLRVDDESVADFEREGAAPFSYRTGDGRRVMKSYWQLPERLYDDEDELAQWARRAHDAARRATMRTGRAVGKAAAPAIRRRARR